MSKYTTGELAKLTGVTVRTVQYYDNRGILVPGELTDGGRRLYNDADLSRMKLICFLRALDMPIDAIAGLLAEEHPEKVIAMLVEQQEERIKKEIDEKTDVLETLSSFKNGLKDLEGFSIEKIGYVATIMKDKKKLDRVHLNMILMCLPASLIQIAAIVILITTGIWWPLLVWAAVAIPTEILGIRYYFNSVKYVCPECHGVFKPAMKEAFFAAHTLKTRKLTCPHCGKKSYCVEIFGREEN